MRKDPMGLGLAALNRLAGSDVIDRIGIRRLTERTVYQGSRTGFSVAGATTRTFTRPLKELTSRSVHPQRTAASGRFDLTPSEDQQMIVDLVSEFGSQVLAPAAQTADDDDRIDAAVLDQSSQLGLNLLNIPESLGGLSEQRSAVTGVLVAEAMAKADMGQAVACLASPAVATAISLWGDTEQQQTYLQPFTTDHVPAASLILAEPQPLYDPFAPETTAVHASGGYRLNGIKSGAVRAGDAELFVVSARLDNETRLFIIEADTPGLSVAADPGMGLRAAGMSQLRLDDVVVPEANLLGNSTDHAECVRLSRLAWSALAAGTGKAVLDYVSEYVTSREAFGEPIAYRQSVAFMVANIGIELEGLRLMTYKAAARADQGADIAREAGLARRLASQYGMQIGTDGVQLLGGHGFVKEHPVERWYRDLRATGLMEGAILV